MDEQCFKGRVSCPTAAGVSKGEEEKIRVIITYMATTYKQRMNVPPKCTTKDLIFHLSPTRRPTSQLWTSDPIHFSVVILFSVLPTVAIRRTSPVDVFVHRA